MITYDIGCRLKGIRANLAANSKGRLCYDLALARKMGARSEECIVSDRG